MKASVLVINTQKLTKIFKGVDALQGQLLTTTIPILATIAWFVVFVGIALWRFEREEF